MTNNRWVYDLGDWRFLYGGAYDPPFDSQTQGLVDLPTDGRPDVEAERCDPNSPTKRRPATAKELLGNLTAKAQATSRQKNILATIAWVIRAKDVAAWNAMTTQEKAAATVTQADRWRDMRVFIEQHL